MLNDLHVWVFVKWELKESKFKIKEPLPVLVISQKPHRTVEFHENPEKRSQAGFWAVILLLQFGIWVSRPRQTDRRDLGFKTSIVRLTELTEILKNSSVASPASPFPHPSKPSSQDTETY
jgi:hypothetical protein